MARITVEDCLKTIPNRFDLILLAAKRTRQLLFGGADSRVDWEDDKATVVALREIAAGHKDFSDAHEVDLALGIGGDDQDLVADQEMLEISDDQNQELNQSRDQEQDQDKNNDQNSDDSD